MVAVVVVISKDGSLVLRILLVGTPVVVAVVEMAKLQ